MESLECDSYNLNQDEHREEKPKEKDIQHQNNLAPWRRPELLGEDLPVQTDGRGRREGHREVSERKWQHPSQKISKNEYFE